MSAYRNYKRRSTSRKKALRDNSLRQQTVMSSPEKLFIETYNTKSGQEKNRYRKNLNSKPVKEIVHRKN